jgi:enamine deaminase RidA (YjgF/YER057c/UK114 family)
MIQSIEARLAEQGLSLPEPAAPVATYAPAVLHGGLLHISGQLPFLDGELMTGRVGEDRAIDYAQEAAKRCALMLLAQAGRALDGDLSRVVRIVKLGVFVNSAPGFTDQAKVANGASQLMIDLLGEAGRHARSAVGVAVLPLGAIVEVEAIIAVR